MMRAQLMREVSHRAIAFALIGQTNDRDRLERAHERAMRQALDQPNPTAFAAMDLATSPDGTTVAIYEGGRLVDTMTVDELRALQRDGALDRYARDPETQKRVEQMLREGKVPP